MFGNRSGRKTGNRANSSRWGAGRRLHMEVLEQRLALTWVGVPPTSVAVPASAVAVTLNAQNDATGTASIATTEIDYYAFTASKSGSYVISATTPASNLDTVLGVFSSTGQRLSYNDDISYPSNTDSRVTINLTAGTRYYVGITNYTGSSRGAYSWTIDGPAPTTTPTTPTDDAYENNDTRATAYNLGTLTAARTVSSLRMADSADWFRFTTSAAGTSISSVSISFLNSQGNLQLALYNSSGGLVRSSLGTGNSESISLSGLAAGTYYVDVYGNAGATNPNYTLTVTPPTVTAPPSSGGGFQITLQMTGLTAAEQAIFQQAANRWSQVITGDLPNATYHGQTVDDLLISASAPTIDGVGGILGQSGPDAFRAGSMLPIHGIMQFDAADMASMVSSGLLYSVVLHEMGHILGIGTLWSDFGLLSGAYTSNPIFTGANATAQYNQIFGTNAAGVPVEATGGPGTADSHWRETVFTNELMTGWAGPGTNLPLSRVTIGSLADLGYTVNYAAADPYTPTSAGLAAARSAANSSLAASRFYGWFGIVGPQDGVSTSVSNAALVSNVATTQQHQLLPGSRVTPIDQDIADYVMAAAGQTTGSHQTTAGDTSMNSTTPDDVASHTSATDDAWESLAADWNPWPALAIA
jgi:Leishmanolysin/Bacterial pre-peptidase C-terminal domain